MQKKRVDALIFDMDGVIVDSEPYHLAAYQEILAGYGHSYCQKDNRQFLGQKDICIAAVLIERFGLETTPEEFVRHKETILDRLLSRHAAPRPGLVPLLEAATGIGLPMAVASSATLPTIKLVIETLGIGAFFRNLTSGDEVKHGKPAPDIFLLAAERLGVSPPGCLVIEDTEAGLQAARAAGMHCVAVPCAATCHQDHSLADEILDSLFELDLAGWTGTGSDRLESSVS